MGKNYLKLISKAKELHYNNITKLKDKTLFHILPPLPKQVKPIQKIVLDTISYLNLPFYENAITKEIALELHKKMEPGDIIFTRAKWHMNNIGIPGFWKHSVLFTGTLDEIDKYFNKDLQINASQIIKEKVPKAYEYMSKSLKCPLRIIEVKRPGVIIKSFEECCKVDYLAVIRPLLSKKDKFNAILKSLKHFGKPYDYNFDAKTDDAFTCSELIFKAYKNMLNIELKEINKRSIISPDTIYSKFKKEFYTPKNQFEFVFFIDQDKEKKIVFQDIKNFINHN